VCVFAIAILVATSPVRGQQDAGVFNAAPDPPNAAAADGMAIRRRWVTIAFEQILATLPQFAPAAQTDRSLVLNLFDDVLFRATLERVEPVANGYLWVGRLQDVPGGVARLSIIDGIVAGTITTADAAYTIRYTGDGLHAIELIDQRGLPPEAPPLEVPDIGIATAEPVTATDDGSRIDLLVVYTPAARTLTGGTTSIQALINLGISETNQAYANSGAIQRLRLVHTQEVNYTEPGSASTTLGQLRTPGDGFMDEVHALRDTYGADLVHLIANSPDVCGIAYLMTSVSPSFAASGFGLTHYPCVSPNYSFAHELGHNMGLRHDTYVDTATTPFAYAHGYVNQAAFAVGAPSSKRWREVLAYNDQCAASGFNCSRILYFANPLLTNTGDPLGDAASADATRALNNTRLTVANFRSEVFSSSSLSINDVTVRERQSGTRMAVLTVSLSAATPSTITVNYATADGSATSAGGDYLAVAGTLTFPAGSLTRAVPVTINGDGVVESDETFVVNLSGASGGSIADGTGAVTIANDDFTDASLTGLPIKAIHLTELRAAVDGARKEKGLAAFSFTDATVTPSGTLAKALHISELRTALEDAYMAASQPAPTYTDPSIVSGETPIKAVHLTELRAAVNGLP